MQKPKLRIKWPKATFSYVLSSAAILMGNKHVMDIQSEANRDNV